MRSRELVKYGRAEGNEEEREWLEVVGGGERARRVETLLILGTGRMVSE